MMFELDFAVENYAFHLCFRMRRYLLRPSAVERRGVDAVELEAGQNGVEEEGSGVAEITGQVAVSYTHLTLPTTPYV